MPPYPDDKFSIDGTKIHLHTDKLAQWQYGDRSTLFPVYVEVSPVGHCNHRCLTGDTKVDTINGPVPIKDLVGLDRVPVYTYSPEKCDVFISDAINIRKIGENEEIVRVWFTDGTHIDCTPDHKLIQIGLGPKKQQEEPKEAQYFVNGDRVRAIRVAYNDKGYADILWSRYGKRKRYRIIMDYLRGYRLSRREQVHHKDRNRGNDAVDNLEYCESAKAHTLLHPEVTARMRANNPTKNGISAEWRAKLTKAITGKKRTLEQRLRYRKSKLGSKNPNYKGLPPTGRTRIPEVNHVVYKVEKLAERQDVYCLEVPATGWFFVNNVAVKNCTFCAVDYIGYKVRKLNTERWIENVQDMSKNNVRSIMYAGEGEPLLHPDIGKITVETAAAGIDVAFTTNGVALTDKFIDEALSSTKWIKVSLNAGDKETYAKIHQTKEKDWDTVWSNLGSAVLRSMGTGRKTVIGAQAVVLPDNIHSLRGLIRKAKETRLDYVVLKPYSQHKKSETRQFEAVSYRESIQALEAMAVEESNEEFRVICRSGAMNEWDKKEQTYQKCYSTPFMWAYVMATGDVYGCSAYLLDDRFKYGNINDNLFSDIWLGDKRKKSIDYVANELNIHECRINCRMNKVNQYMWDLKHPSEHKNFI